jgi:hypothetical protein
MMLQLAHPFRLQPPRVEREVRTALPPCVPGTPEALAALKAADLKRLELLELAWLNAYGPKPVIPEAMMSPDLCDSSCVPIAIQIIPGGLPDGHQAVMWVMVTPCPNCSRRVFPTANCCACGGNGYLNDDGIWQSFYCDADANVIFSDA